MYYIGDELDKIKIIDQAFTSLSLDEVKSIFGAEAIVNKLKGETPREGPLSQAVRELQTMSADISMLRSESQMLKNDIQILVRCLNKGMGDQCVAGDFNNLKQRHSIY